MTLVGYLHHRADPNKVRHAYAFMAVAKAEGIDFVYFTPGRINVQDETINGWVYEDGRWVERIVGFPDAVYNEAIRSDKHWWAIEAMRRTVPFTSHPIGDKMAVYDRLKRGKKFYANLIPSKELENPERDLRELLTTYGSVVVKPLWGAKGVGVMAVDWLGDDRVRWMDNGQTTEGNLRDFVKTIEPMHEGERLLVQQRITCVTKDGYPYDFRIHVQKDGCGKWTVTSVYHRVAAAGNVTSNLSSGGYTGFLDTFLQREFGSDWFNVKCYLRQFGFQLAAHMDEVYDESFDELGIDVGLDDMRKAVIYEINWKPGPPPVWLLELDVARNSLLYAVYLAKQQRVQPAEVVSNKLCGTRPLAAGDMASALF